MTKWIPAILAMMLFGLGCDVISISEAPLDEQECGQLTDKIHEVLRQGLDEESLEWWDADHAAERADSIRECVEDPSWGRKGFQCLMAATSEGELKRCVLTNR